MKTCDRPLAEPGDEPRIFLVRLGAAQNDRAERFDLGRVDYADGMTFFREERSGRFPINSGRLHAGVSLLNTVPFQPGGQLFKAFRRVGNDLAPDTLYPHRQRCRAKYVQSQYVSEIEFYCSFFVLCPADAV
jgi:hypothetical protein